MNPLKINDVTQYVEENIGIFHQKRIGCLDKLKLKTVLKNKNPFSFKRIFKRIFPATGASGFDERSKDVLREQRMRLCFRERRTSKHEILQLGQGALLTRRQKSDRLLG